MSAFTPSSIRGIAILAAALVTVLLAGLVIVQIRSRAVARAAAWTLAVAAVLFADRATASEPPGVRMLAVIGLLFYAMKVRCRSFSIHRFSAVWCGRSWACRPEAG